MIRRLSVNFIDESIKQWLNMWTIDCRYSCTFIKRCDDHIYNNTLPNRTPGDLVRQELKVLIFRIPYLRKKRNNNDRSVRILVVTLKNILVFLCQKSVGFIRRGEMPGYILPGPAAGYYLHGLPGYGPAVLSAGALPAFMPAGMDPLAAYTAALPSSMHTLSFDSPVAAAGAPNTDGSISDLSPTPTTSIGAVNGLDQNGGGPAMYNQPGYGIFLCHCICVSFQNLSIFT